jgi:hypothetical protein
MKIIHAISAAISSVIYFARIRSKYVSVLFSNVKIGNKEDKFCESDGV